MPVDATTASSQTQTLAALTGANTQPGSARVTQKTLGQDDFFKLLTTQLSSQDPLKPMEDTAFIAQMASFSQLEMQSKLTDSFDKFTNMQQLNVAQGYLDKNITTSDGAQGKVTAVGYNNNGDTVVYLDGGPTGYNVKSINNVSN